MFLFGIGLVIFGMALWLFSFTKNLRDVGMSRYARSCGLWFSIIGLAGTAIYALIVVWLSR